MSEASVSRPNELAAQFADEGDTSPLGERRIRAMRALAGGHDPILGFHDVSELDRRWALRVADRPTRGPRAPRVRGNPTDPEPRRHCFGRRTLAKVGTAERLGPITLAKIMDWLGRLM